MLVNSETMNAFSTVNEIIDANKYRYIGKKHLLQKTIKDNRKPSVFWQIRISATLLLMYR